MAPKCYKGTDYFPIIRNLLDKPKNSESTEKCPKCATVVHSYYTLMVHIEKHHPSDVKHKPYSKQVPQLEETVNQTVSNLELNDAQFEAIDEDFHTFQPNDSFIDSSTLNELKDNPFFKVIVHLILKFI